MIIVIATHSIELRLIEHITMTMIMHGDDDHVMIMDADDRHRDEHEQ